MDIDQTVTVMEVLMSLVLLAKPCAKPAELWLDMDPIREAARRRKHAEDDDGDAPSPLPKRRSKPTTSATRTSTPTVTTLSIRADENLQLSGYQPLYARLVPSGLVRASLESPSTEADLVEVIINHAADVSPDSSFGSDKVPSLSWTSNSHDILQSPPCEVILREYLGHGRTFDAFAATLSVHLPSGDTVQVPTVLKHIELLSLENFAEAQDGYPTRTHVLRSAEREARTLRVLADTCPDVAPRLFAFWQSVAYHHVILATEDCCDPLAQDLKTLDDDTKGQVVGIYRKLHVAGVLHGDVHPRHIMRDSKDRVRIVDFEGSRELDMSSAEGAAAAQQEMDAVYKMLGISV